VEVGALLVIGHFDSGDGEVIAVAGVGGHLSLESVDLEYAGGGALAEAEGDDHDLVLLADPVRSVLDFEDGTHPLQVFLFVKY